VSGLTLALLSTDTTHHVFWAQQLARRHSIAAVFLEHPAPAPFPVAHPFEVRRDEYERDVLLAGQPPTWREIADTHHVDSLNDATTVEQLRALRPDVVLVFGTGRLAEPVFTAAPTALNLHGGNPERYRGLDTHLWAIYHDDFADLVTTLHRLERDLDTGDIVLMSKVPLVRGMELHELRAANARTCVDLSLLALTALEQGALPSRPQAARGRYYSAMPAVLKDLCVRRFARRLTAS
jgi:methionyl-tRNA formyltransferase